MLSLPDRIALIGMMGSGKTTIGKMLAPKISYAFVDLDQHIEENEKRSIAAIFEKEGRAHFRMLEHEALTSFSSWTQLLLSTGGGAPTLDLNAQLLKKYYYTIHLQVDPEVAAHRLFEERLNRPLIAQCSSLDEVISAMHFIWKSRASFYQAADLTIDVSSLSKEELVEKLQNLLFENFNKDLH